VPTLRRLRTACSRTVPAGRWTEEPTRYPQRISWASQGLDKLPSEVTEHESRLTFGAHEQTVDGKPRAYTDAGVLNIFRRVQSKVRHAKTSSHKIPSADLAPGLGSINPPTPGFAQFPSCPAVSARNLPVFRSSKMKRPQYEHSQSGPCHAPVAKYKAHPYVIDPIHKLQRSHSQKSEVFGSLGKSFTAGVQQGPSLKKRLQSSEPRLKKPHTQRVVQPEQHENTSMPQDQHLPFIRPKGNIAMRPVLARPLRSRLSRGYAKANAKISQKPLKHSFLPMFPEPQHKTSYTTLNV
jgi:hypothetical protein